MIHKLIKSFEQISALPTASAHCDIPCKIYDPSTAQIAALTIVRMMDLIAELDAGGNASDPIVLNNLSRFIAAKEEHGIKVKDEIRIIWGDYFKQPQLEAFPEIHDLTHQIMLLASACKQSIDREKAIALIDAVNRFAEIFWATKDVKVKKATCPYPPALEMVYPDL
ncbi:MAG: superoxide dismutase, Ni [Pseudomonadota bacterium]